MVIASFSTRCSRAVSSLVADGAEKGLTETVAARTIAAAGLEWNLDA